jgi:hypothetical protein
VVRRLFEALRGRVKSDYQVTYPGGSSVRRVERRRVEWYVNGEPSAERQAKAFIEAKEGPEGLVGL